MTQYLNPTPSNFSYQQQQHKRYIIITTIMYIITFTTTITTKAEEINGDSWSNNVKQRPCRHMFNRMSPGHRTRDE
jgi:hypothetical protein